MILIINQHLVVMMKNYVPQIMITIINSSEALSLQKCLVIMFAASASVRKTTITRPVNSRSFTLNRQRNNDGDDTFHVCKLLSCCLY